MVIENKLDDSGRDVVWQAVKYVAYCSSLTKAEIVKIYQKYPSTVHLKVMMQQQSCANFLRLRNWTMCC